MCEHVHVVLSLCEQQEKVQIRKELWRIEDVIAGLSTTKANYKVTVSSVTNPGEGPRLCRGGLLFEGCALTSAKRSNASLMKWD